MAAGLLYASRQHVDIHTRVCSCVSLSPTASLLTMYMKFSACCCCCCCRAQASRVLKPGGLLVVAFGPHCFKEKAVAAWLNRDMKERVQLLTE